MAASANNTNSDVNFNELSNDDDDTRKAKELLLLRQTLPDQIAVVDSPVPYTDIFEVYIAANRPCLLTSNFTQNWFSRKNWVTNDQQGNDQIDFDFLSETYGDERVNVTVCQMAPGGGECETIEMTVREYLKYWQEYRASKYSASHPCLYLKDWHILRCKSVDPNVPIPYEIPLHFKSDWLNEYCSGKNMDDFCFCYMGPKGSWTGFHSDVYGSFSWSANVIGRKKWRLYLQGKIDRFQIKKDRDGRTIVEYKYDYDNPGEEGVDYFEIIQDAGQVIFVPSGWFHVVWNLEDTISINHNWFNAANVDYIWERLRSALNYVELELNDLVQDDDFPNLCQSLLKASHGMNYEDFFDILLFILSGRVPHAAAENPGHDEEHSKPIVDISAVEPIKSHFSTGTALGPKHTQLDLHAIKEVVTMIKTDLSSREISNHIKMPGSVHEKLSKLENIICKC